MIIDNLSPAGEIATSVGAYLRLLMEVDDAHLVDIWTRRLSVGAQTDHLMSHRLLTKRFRGSPLDRRVAQRVANVTSYVVREGIPLTLLIPFGGYKSPASREYPEASWSEIFSVAGMCELVSPICAIHSPGVILEFCSDEVIVPLLTGATIELLESYRRRFDYILAMVGRKQRSNLRLHQSLLRSCYDIENLVYEIQELGHMLESTWFPFLEDREQQRLLRAAANNRFIPLSENCDRRMATLRQAACAHEAFVAIDSERRADILFAPATVPVALRRGLDRWLHLGSNRRSATQFWIGSGLLDMAASAPKAHILPPGRAAQIWPRIVRVPTNLTDVEGFDNIPVVL